MQLLQKRNDRISSPIVDQIEFMGGQTDTHGLAATKKRWAASTRPSHAKIDAVCLPVNGSDGILVKAIGFSAIKSASGRLKLGSEFAPLFSASGRIISGCRAPARYINTLVRAEQMLAESVPGSSWKKHLLLVDDDYSWRFQSYNLTSERNLHCAVDSVDVDSNFETSSLDFAGQLRDDPDYFQRIPTAGGADVGQLDLQRVLGIAPLDRYVRSMSHLRELLDVQLKSDSLASVEATGLHALIESGLGLRYPRDMRRHDLEDCLRARGLARRLPYRNNAYAITDVGMFAIRTLIQKYNPMCAISTDALLDLCYEQARRWGNAAGPLAG